MRIIIGLMGLLGSGKSEAANHLVLNHGFQRIKFAGPLKNMMRALGLGENEIEGDRKELPCNLLGGKTPRFAMQTLGTEWGRNLIDPGLWVRAWMVAVGGTAEDSKIVVDDVRFPNEVRALLDMAPELGRVIRIVRPMVGKAPSSHVSEHQGLSADHEILNDGSIDKLYENLDVIVEGLR